MGSRSSIEKAYIAGFLDGDGSLMLQIKKRADTKRGYRFMATICLYQDSRHDLPLYWMQKCLQAGYISKRNDKITELRVNGFVTVHNILTELEPYIRFKEVQATALLAGCKLLQSKKKLSKHDLHKLIEIILCIQNENYSAHRKKSEEDMLKILGLTP